METPGTSIIAFIRVGGIVTGLFILLATWIAARILEATLAKLSERFTHKRLLINQVSTLVRFAIYITGIILAVMASFRLSREVILAITGTAAVALGFALKDLAASVLAGLIIIIDRPFQVGDRVNFNGTYGDILSIGLRSVRLFTLDHNVVTIPNNKFLTDIVSSGNWGDLEMLVQMDFHIGLDQDLVLAKRLVGECLTNSPYVFTGKPWEVLVSQTVIGDYITLRLRAKAYVMDVQYEKTFETDVTERVMEAFNRYGIRPPTILHRQLPDQASPES
ncbi:MAG TPA: mechanosensitive ion channel [Deltaproteobacteria bacterium]|nr:mechanosensitive ion channel [Deltaproteobacteria bacterium]HPR55479.1 mechanosensitive ion channel [Deltaproteobacteria bacterium]HXK47491.1 mechanosensitive ion channel [Deltaproteobacteria bacterium]